MTFIPHIINIHQMYGYNMYRLYNSFFSLFPSFCIFFLILLCLPFLFNLYFYISFSSLCFFLEYFLPSSSFLFITLFPYFFLFSSLHIISFSFTFPDFFHFSSFLIFSPSLLLYNLFPSLLFFTIILH